MKFVFLALSRFGVKSAFGLSSVMSEGALQLFVIIFLGFPSSGQPHVNVEITDKNQGLSMGFRERNVSRCGPV